MAGVTRRLPPWMHGGASADAATSSNRTDVDSFSVKGRLSSEACQPKAEKQIRRTIKRREKEIVEVRSGARRNLAKKTRREGRDSDVTKHDDLGCTVGEFVRRKRRKAKGDGEGFEVESRVGQDEEDLTVDDLLSIAQEYVRAEDDMKMKSAQSEPVTEPADTTAEKTKATGLGTSGEGRREKEGCGSRTSGGDVTEEMLFLLLGPLLKKSEEERKRREIMGEVVELRSEREEGDECGGGEVRQKKKSSLKDTVSTFLASGNS